MQYIMSKVLDLLDDVMQTHAAGDQRQDWWRTNRYPSRRNIDEFKKLVLPTDDPTNTITCERVSVIDPRRTVIKNDNDEQLSVRGDFAIVCDTGKIKPNPSIMLFLRGNYTIGGMVNGEILNEDNAELLEYDMAVAMQRRLNKLRKSPVDAGVSEIRVPRVLLPPPPPPVVYHEHVPDPPTTSKRSRKISNANIQQALETRKTGMKPATIRRSSRTV